VVKSKAVYFVPPRRCSTSLVVCRDPEVLFVERLKSSDWVLRSCVVAPSDRDVSGTGLGRVGRLKDEASATF
jgi:hypothetical protein